MKLRVCWRLGLKAFGCWIFKGYKDEKYYMQVGEFKFMIGNLGLGQDFFVFEKRLENVVIVFWGCGF